MTREQILELADRLDTVRKGMEAGLDDWPTASQIWEYQQASKALRSLVVESDAAIESYKAELLKDVGEPAGYISESMLSWLVSKKRKKEKWCCVGVVEVKRDSLSLTKPIFTESQLLSVVAKKDKEIEELRHIAFYNTDPMDMTVEDNALWLKHFNYNEPWRK